MCNVGDEMRMSDACNALFLNYIFHSRVYVRTCTFPYVVYRQLVTVSQLTNGWNMKTKKKKKRVSSQMMHDPRSNVLQSSIYFLIFFPWRVFWLWLDYIQKLIDSSRDFSQLTWLSRQANAWVWVDSLLLRELWIVNYSKSFYVICQNNRWALGAFTLKKNWKVECIFFKNVR